MRELVRDARVKGVKRGRSKLVKEGRMEGKKDCRRKDRETEGGREEQNR